MASVGQVTIDVSANTAKLQSGMTKAQQQMQTSVSKMKKSMKSLNASIGAVTIGITATVAAFGKFTKVGFDYNNQVEQATAGLTALTVATSANQSALGKTLTIQEKYTLATKEAVETMKSLEAINATTPHTLTQTNEIYKAMYVSMKKVGASNEDMIKVTEKISIAAGAAGIQFNSLLAGVDGLATGTVLANSDLGRFLNSLGLNNKALKESDDVTGLLLKTLSGFEAVDTYTVAMSNFENSVSQAMGLSTQSMFNDTKDSVKALTSVINNNKEEIAIFATNTVKAFKIAGTAVALTVIEVEKAATKLALINAKVANAVTFGFSDKTKANIKAYKNEIALLDKQDEILTKDLNKIYNSWGKITAETKKSTLANKANADSLVKKVNAPEADEKALKKAQKLEEKKAKTLKDSLEKQQQELETFNENMTMTLAEPYEKLMITRENYLADFGTNAESRLLIEKWYNKEVEKLNTSEVASYTKAQETKTKALANEAKLAKELEEEKAKANRTWQDGATDSLNTYLDSAKDMYTQMNNATTSAMYGMEDALVSFVQTGKLNFKDLANSIIADIIRIQVKQAIAGIASSGIGSLVSGLFGSAKGNVFSNGQPQQFAKGGLPFGSNLQFAMAGGGVGSMNEQGQEAIMPLTRGLGGELGVKAIGGGESGNITHITINNESGIALDMDETSRSSNGNKEEILLTVTTAAQTNNAFRKIMGIK